MWYPKIKIHACLVEAVEADLCEQRFPEADPRRTSSLRPRRYIACVTIRNPSFNDIFREKFRIDLYPENGNIQIFFEL